MSLIEILTVLCCGIGVSFMLISSIGLLHLPDLYTRIHAAGKTGTLGIIGVLLGAGIYAGDVLTLTKQLALIAFFMFTAPVAAHMLDRAAYLTGVKPVISGGPDELAGRYDEQGHLS